MDIFEARDSLFIQLDKAIAYSKGKINSGEGDISQYKVELERVEKLYDELKWFGKEF